MENQDILELLSNYNCYTQVNVCVLQTWEHIKGFSCIDNPKQNDLLLYVNQCKVTYKMKDEETFSAINGDIIYIPTGKEYTLNIDERDSENGCTYGINFLVFDENHKRLLLKNNGVFSNNKHLKKIFGEMSDLSDAGKRYYAKLQALFYEIIVALSVDKKKHDIKNYSAIEKGIEYLEKDTTLSLNIADIAKMCNVSHNYFCKLFKAYSGITPEEYILKAKMEKAKTALKETQLSISEIAEQIGFQDSSYFCRIFKRKCGVSPLKYRKMTEEYFI